MPCYCHAMGLALRGVMPHFRLGRRGAAAGLRCLFDFSSRYVVLEICFCLNVSNYCFTGRRNLHYYVQECNDQILRLYYPTI